MKHYLLSLAIVAGLLTNCTPGGERYSKPSTGTSSAQISLQQNTTPVIPNEWSYKTMIAVPLSVPLPADSVVFEDGFESMDSKTVRPNTLDQWFSIIFVSQQPWNGTLSDYIKQTYKDTTICTRKHANPEFDRSDYVYELSTPCPASGPGESEHKYLVLVNGVVYHLRDDKTETTASGKILQDIAVFNIRSADNITEPTLSPAQVPSSSDTEWKQITLGSNSLLLSLPSTAYIQFFPADNPYYQQGERVSIMSMSPTDFYRTKSESDIQNSFVLSAFEPITIDQSFDTWLSQLCSQQHTINRVSKNTSENYTLYDFYTGCVPQRNYALLHGTTLYRFEAGDDTHNYDNIWTLLLNVKFEPTLSSSASPK